jgi:serine/threonine protein kinase
LDQIAPVSSRDKHSSTSSPNSKKTSGKSVEYDSKSGNVLITKEYNELELEILRELRRERYIAQLVSFEERSDLMVLTMPLLNGSLRTIPSFRDQTDKFLIKSIQFVSNVLSGLNVLAQHKIIHRDLNFTNVMYSESHSTFQLIDFGQSIRYDSSIRIPVGEDTFGTKPYIAPEVLNGVDYTPSIDIYSVGKMAEFLFMEALQILEQSIAQRIQEFIQSLTAEEPYRSTLEQAVEQLNAIESMYSISKNPRQIIGRSDSSTTVQNM